jgi:hypothetical protein
MARYSLFVFSLRLFPTIYSKLFSNIVAVYAIAYFISRCFTVPCPYNWWDRFHR